jgi:carbon-monoxide dehydrogenase large subunit
LAITAQAPYGTGTYASRAATLGGGAAILAAGEVRERARRIAAHLLETDAADNIAQDGEVWWRGAPERLVSLKQIAHAAYAGTKWLPKGMEPGLEATRFYHPYYGTVTSATHAAVIEIDRDTCAVKILRYVVAEDCGGVINPLISTARCRAASRRESARRCLRKSSTTPTGNSSART